MPESSDAHPHKSWRQYSSVIAYVILSIVGLFDSLLLTVEHYSRRGLPCSFTGGCERVLTSKWSEFFGIPISLGGVVFYGLILFLVVHSLVNKTPLNRFFMLFWSIIGFITSVYLTLIQAFIIKAWCQYCLLSALTTTLVFILSIVIFARARNK